MNENAAQNPEMPKFGITVGSAIAPYAGGYTANDLDNALVRLAQAKPVYQPSDAFIARHGFEINEAEIWVELVGGAPFLGGGRIVFSKDSGRLMVYNCREQQEYQVFAGFPASDDHLELLLEITARTPPPGTHE